MRYDIRMQIGNLTAAPTDSVHRVIASKNPDAALLFLYALTTGGDLDPDTACPATGMTVQRLKTALALLLELGVMGASDMPPPKEQKTAPAPVISEKAARAAVPAASIERVEYTPEEIARGMAGDRAFAFLYRETESRLGRVLRQFEASSLYSMYDYLHLPAEVIVLLVHHMADEAEARIRDGRDVRALSFRELSREACRWSDEGVNTAERADTYIKKKAERKSAFTRVARMLGIRDRLPAPTESRLINAWLDMGTDPTLIERAYDITVTNKGSLVWPYMRSILERWQKKGYKTPADVDAGEAPRGTQDRPSRTPGVQSEPGAQERAYLERVKRRLRTETGES